MTVPVRQRIVEVVADFGEESGDRWRYGSGLLIGGRSVLTAAHVVVGAVAATVRGTDKRLLRAELDPDLIGEPETLDLALLEVPELAPGLAEVPVAVVDRGTSTGDFVEGCWSVGYPAFQQIVAEDRLPIRETAQVAGRIPPLSGLVGGLLTLQVTAKPRELPVGRTLDKCPWSGMSGAAVFAYDQLVGVVAEHAPRRGSSDISVTPLQLLAEAGHAPANAATWWNRLGVSDPSTLPRLPSAAGPTQSVSPQRIFDVPSPAAVFTGRAAELGLLRRAMATTEAHPLVQAITGLGGLGKTQLACAYARAEELRYRIAWRVRAGSPMVAEGPAGAHGVSSDENTPATLLEDLRRLGVRAGVVSRTEPDLRAVALHVVEWLAGQRDWLLIFDDASVPTQIKEFIPSGAGHVIITSRYPAWRQTANDVLTLDVWTDAESVQFLQGRTGASESDEAAQLARQLGHLPLALEQAAGYIEVSGIGISEYRSRYAREAARLLESARPLDYHETVATTWGIAFDELRRTNSAAASILELCSFMAADSIPEEVFRRPLWTLPKSLLDVVSDDLAFDDATVAAMNRSLLRRSGGRLAVHPLVQLVAREALTTEDRERCAATAVQLISTAWPEGPGSAEQWALAGALLSHAQVATRHASELGVQPQKTVRLLLSVASYLLARAQLDEAATATMRAREVIATSFKPTDPMVAEVFTFHGHILLAQQRAEDARSCFEHALSLCQSAPWAGAGIRAVALNNLGLCLLRLNDAPQAEAHVREGLDLLGIARPYDRVAQPHPAASLLGTLASALTAQRQGADAEPFARRALELTEQGGADPTHIAAALTNLAKVLRQLQRLDEAESLVRQAIMLDQEALGPNHPQILTHLAELDRISRDARRATE